MNMKDIIISTNAQKVLNFLIQEPGREYLSSEIHKSTGISKAGINFSLKDLVKAGFVKIQKKGKFYIYSAKFANPVIKQIKIASMLIFLTAFLNKLKKSAIKIILFGSVARGENDKNSDIDILVITNNRDEVEKNIRSRFRRLKLQLIIRTPVEYAEMEKKEKIFYKEVERGIILWERIDES